MKLTAYKMTGILIWWSGEPEFHIHPYNSRKTPPMKKSVTTKNVTNKISVSFCFNVIRVKHREDDGKAREVVHTM